MIDTQHQRESYSMFSVGILNPSRQKFALRVVRVLALRAPCSTVPTASTQAELGANAEATLRARSELVAALRAQGPPGRLCALEVRVLDIVRFRFMY